MDNRHPGENRIRQVIDSRLSGMETSPGFERNVLGRVRGEIIVKKKLSVAFVLIMVLVLLAAGALAALLSSKEFVGQILAPLAVKDSSEKWTSEQTDEIIRLAEENGITVTDEIRKHLNSVDGTYKEELMRVFVKMDLGFYPASWSIDDQAWYDELLVKCGFSDKQTRFTPTANEISMEQAITTSISYISDTFGDLVDITDEKRYRRFVEYREFVEQDNIISPRMWYIRYESFDSALSSYDFVISSEGTIKEANSEPGIKSMQGTSTVESVLDYYTLTYGLHYDWTQKIWMELQKDVERAVAAHGHNGRLSLTILRQQYGTPDAQDISQEKAIEAALEAIVKESGISKTDLVGKYKARALYLLGKDGPIWKVSFVNTEPKGPYTYILRHAEVDAHTGMTTNIGYYQPGLNKWYEAYVLVNTIHDDSDTPSHG